MPAALFFLAAIDLPAPAPTPWLLYTPLALALAGLLVWTYLNLFAGLKTSLQYQLPPPPPPPPEDPPQAPLSSEIQNPKSKISSQLPGGLPGAGVAIIAPGRNEAAHLPQSLPDLCQQDYPGPLRVLFIDDASTDATPAICRAALRQFPDRLTVIRNTVEPPPGWVGKCWAIHRGVRQLVTHLEDGDAPTPWLCFTDADLRWHPDLLAAAMGYALEHDADVLAVIPTLTFASPWETIVQLQLMLALGIMVPFEKAMDPRKKNIALAGGAFILVKRETYDAVGGHESVKGEVVEDLKLGLALKQHGAKMRVAFAGKLQWCRMYDSHADMWEGLTKNAYAGLNYSLTKAAALLLLTLALNIAPMPLALASLIWLVFSPTWISAATFLCAALTTILQARVLNAVRKLARHATPDGTPPQKPLPVRYAWTMPLGSAAYSLILLASIWHAHTRGNTWKGRRYRAA